MEKFLENIEQAEKIIQTTDYLTYMTFPLIKDKRLLLKIISEIKIAIAKSINSILQYEYLYKRILLHKDPKLNFKTFKEKCAKKYNITEQEIKLILELFDIVEKHKKSSMEFLRKEKIVILSNNSEPRIITLEKTKEFLTTAKNILHFFPSVVGKHENSLEFSFFEKRNPFQIDINSLFS